jgi:hypothetical protein
MSGRTRHARRPAGALVILAALLSCSGGIAAARAGRARLYPVITPNDSWVHRSDERRNFVSPDGKYIARLQHGEANVWELSIVDSRSGQRLIRDNDVDGLVWVPRHPHRLVIATCAIYTRARLSLWEGGRRWRSLRPVKRPDAECFMLYGVAANGRFIVYGHDPDLGADPPGRNPIDRRRWLRLPSP